jgi:branched-chain amino acid transport system permease protein
MTLFAQQLINGLVVGSTYALIAVGFALVLSVMRLVNLAHPEFFMIAMFIGVNIVGNVTNNLLLVVLGVAIGTAGLALILERIVLRPLRREDHLMPLIATAGVSILIQNVMAGLTRVDPIPFPPLLPVITFHQFGVQISLAQAANIVLAVLMVAVVAFYVKRTKWGRATRAVAENPDVAASVGVNVVRVYQVTVVLAAVLAAVAGLSVGGLYESAWAFIATFYTLKAFIVMLVAGNRHIEGILAVGMLLGLIEVFVTGYVSSNLRDAIAFPMLIGILFFRPKGIFGSYAT